MFDWLQKHAAKILGITRMLFGTMMALHGAQKVFLLFGGLPPYRPSSAGAPVSSSSWAAPCSPSVCSRGRRRSS